MDQGSATLAIVIGSVAIVASFFVQNFYAAKGMYGELSDKQIPTRMGRIFFCVVGGMFILIGIMFFFPNQ
jgi:hypothetical protein